MADILRELTERRAYRAMSEEHIGEDKVQRLLEAAVLAPSCANKQPWRFLVINSPGGREKVQRALSGGNYWAKKADLYIGLLCRPEDDCQLEDQRDYALFDTGMAAMALQLQAVREGLYVHPIAGFDDLQLKKAFHVLDEEIFITILVIAYPGEGLGLSEKHQQSERSERDRLKLSSVTYYQEWGDEKTHG